jgi:predicted lipoprotein with Yx(FWY)xxD motif
MKRISVFGAAPLLVAAALVAGCGSSSKSASTPSSSASSATPASSSASSTQAPYGAATPSSSSSASGAAITVSTKQSKLGTVLAGKKHLTLYLFEADKNGQSACSGTCAQVWAPLTGTPKVGGKAVSADLGTITRSDGTKQVTYKGHPLYYFAKDKDSGDAYGQGIKSFGAAWYVVAPSGNKIDNS